MAIDFVIWVSGSGGGYPASAGGPPASGGELNAAEFFRTKLGRAFFYRPRGGYGQPYHGMAAGQTDNPVIKDMSAANKTFLQRPYAGYSTNLKTYGANPTSSNDGGLLQHTLDGYFDPYIGHQIDDLNTLGALGIKVYIELWSEMDVGNAGSNQPPAADGPWVDAMGPGDMGARIQFRDWWIYWHDHIQNGTTAHPTGLLHDNVVFVASMSSNSGWSDSGNNKAAVFLKPLLDYEIANSVTLVDVIACDTYSKSTTNGAGPSHKTVPEMYDPAYNYAVAHGKKFGILETGYAAAVAGSNAAELALKPAWFDSWATWIAAREANIAVIEYTESERNIDSSEYEAEAYVEPADPGNVDIRNGYTSPSWLRFQALFNQPMFTAENVMTKSHTTNAIIKKTLTKTHQSMAVISKVATRTHQTDARLSKVLTRTHQTDAVIQQGTQQRSHGTDAVIRKTLTRSHGTDAFLYRFTVASADGWGPMFWGLGAWGGDRTFFAGHTTDAMIKTTTKPTHSTDARILKVTKPTHSTDALIRKVATKTHSTDAILRATGLVAHQTDAYVKPLAKVSHTTDAYVSLAGRSVHQTDGVIAKTLTKTHSTDAVLLRGASLAHGTDAVIAARVGRSHQTDGVIAARVSVAHSTDAQVLGAGMKVHSTDALIRTDLSLETHGTDAVIRVAFARAHFTDAFIGARLVIEQRTDALILGIETPSHQTDAIVLGTLFPRHETDAYIFDEYPFWPADETALTIFWGEP